MAFKEFAIVCATTDPPLARDIAVGGIFLDFLDTDIKHKRKSLITEHNKILFTSLNIWTFRYYTSISANVPKDVHGRFLKGC